MKKGPAQVNCVHGKHRERVYSLHHCQQSILEDLRSKLCQQSAQEIYWHILAALHFNENLKREVKINTDEKTKVLVTYPKFKNGEAIVREARVEQTFEDINQLYTTLEKALHNCNLEASKIALKEMTPPPLSDSMKKQDRETAVKKHHARKTMVNKEVPSTNKQTLENKKDNSKRKKSCSKMQ
ncbi:uncharacterized protein LOC135687679 isoform X2 [Rhopilema esculentum]|uniref:uncharacterized protein LOC135687679 isoform X2 n=1 Tax=Rhopilema esculentum TaxID=499914 RepID=UPI0031E42E53